VNGGKSRAERWRGAAGGGGGRSRPWGRSRGEEADQAGEAVAQAAPLFLHGRHGFQAAHLIVPQEIGRAALRVLHGHGLGQAYQMVTAYVYTGHAKLHGQ